MRVEIGEVVGPAKLCFVGWFLGSPQNEVLWGDISIYLFVVVVGAVGNVEIGESP